MECQHVCDELRHRAAAALSLCRTVALLLLLWKAKAMGDISELEGEAQSRSSAGDELAANDLGQKKRPKGGGTGGGRGRDHALLRFRLQLLMGLSEGNHRLQLHLSLSLKAHPARSCTGPRSRSSQSQLESDRQSLLVVVAADSTPLLAALASFSLGSGSAVLFFC